MTDLLPGLWVVALLVVAGWGLRRWFDPVPARVLALYGLLVALLFGPALFAGRVLLPLDHLTDLFPFRQLAQEEPNRLQSDVIREVTPWAAQVRHAYRNGEWPLWTPRIAAGMPLLANPQAQHLQPLVLAALPFSLAAAAGVTAALKLLVALIGTFLLLRRQGLGEAAAALGSVAYGLGGYVMLWLAWPLSSAAAWLPVALYAVRRVESPGGWRDRLLLVAAVASLLLAGHPETTFYGAVAVAAFAVARLAARPRGVRRAAFAAWGSCAALAAALAAPVLLPVAAQLDDSMRYLLVSERRAGPESWGVWLGLEREEEVSAAERLLPVAAPHAFGHDLFGAFWGEQNINVSGAKFAGSVALLLAAVALAPLRRGRRYPQERWALGLALVMLVVLARSPGMAAALLQVPLLRNSASLGGRGAFLLVLALAWLAACACDRWRRHGLDDGRVAMAAGGLAALLAWGYASHPSPQGEEVLLGLRWGTLGLQLATLAGAVSLLWAGRRPRRGGVVAAALVALAASELAVVHWPIHESHPRELFYPPVEPIAFLQDNLGDDRMVALTYMLPANIPALYGLSDVRIADPLEPVAYSQLVGPLRMEGHFTTAALDAPEHPLYDLLGVRLVLGPWGRQLDPPIHRVFARGSSWIWERPGALPRLFLPQSAEVAAEPKWWRWSRQRPEYARRALAEAVPGHQEGWQAQRPAPPLLPVPVGDTRWRAEVALGEERLLASGIYQDGGWRLLLSGRPRPTLRVNGPLVGAWLPPGRWRLDLLYWPPGFLPGVLLAALAAVGLLVWLAPPPAAPLPPRRERRGEAAA